MTAASRSRSGSSTHIRALHVVAAFALCGILLVGLVATEWPLLTSGDTSRDFPLLYVAASRAATNQPLYAEGASGPGPLLNFNPPHFHAILVPFTWLPLRPAYLLWNVLSLALLLIVIRLAFNEAPPTGSGTLRWLIIAAILGSAGVAATLRMGQVSMWIALLVTLAWRAARRGHETTAGLWLGLALSIKPFLLLAVPILAVRGRWRATVASVAVAAAALASGGLWLGWSALSDWLEVLQSPRRATSFALNASVWGVLARAGLPEAVAVFISIVIAAVTVWRARSADEDTAWTLAIAAALLCSPLGWIYYLPLLTGPLLVLALSRRLPPWSYWLAPAFLPAPLSPVVLQEPRIVAVTLGSVYGWALLGTWFAALTSRNYVHNGSGLTVRE
jgi:hypothetical protein